MNILFLSKNGEGLSLAQRVSNEGHCTYFHILTPSMRTCGNGLLEKPRSTQPLLFANDKCIKSNVLMLLREVQPELVVMCSTGMGDIADYLVSKGVRVFGGCRWADVLNSDDTYNHALLTINGCKCESEDIDVTMLWNGLSASTYTITHTYRKAMNEEVGADVECAGNILQWLPATSPYRVQLQKLEHILKKVCYKGFVTLNVRDGLLKCEVKYDEIYALLELYRGSVTALLFNTCTGTNVLGNWMEGTAVTVRLSIPPYPFSPCNEEVQIEGIEDKMLTHIHFNDVRFVDGEYKSARTSGLIGCVSARGVDKRECRRRVYRTISNLHINQLQYRTDIAD